MALENYFNRLAWGVAKWKWKCRLVVILRVPLQAVFLEDLEKVSSQGGRDKGKPSIIAAYSESARSDISYAGPDFDSKTHHNRSPKEKKRCRLTCLPYQLASWCRFAKESILFFFPDALALKLLLLPIIFFSQTMTKEAIFTTII